MTASRSLRIPWLLLAAAMLAACAAGPAPSGPAVEGRGEETGPPVVATHGGLLSTGRALADLLRSRYPDYAEAWRMAVGWNTRAGWLDPLGDGFVQRWHGCVLLRDLGAVAANEDQAFMQLDPSTFSGLVWIHPEVSPTGELEALTVGLRSTRSAPLVRIRVGCDPPLPLVAQPPTSSPGAARRWLGLDAPARALFWEEPAGRLWVALPDRILRLDPSSRSSVQTIPLDLPGAPGPGLAVLASLGEEGAPQRVGYFNLSAGKGWWFDRGSGGAYARGADLEGLPLSDRLLRFFTGPFDAPAGCFLLSDYRGKTLGESVAMVRFMGVGGSLFGILRPEGNWAVLKGDDLTLAPAPQQGQASALASFGALLLVAGRDRTLAGYRLADNQGTWEKDVAAGPLPGDVTALCAGTLEGRPTVFAAVEDQGRGEILAVELPSSLK